MLPEGMSVAVYWNVELPSEEWNLNSIPSFSMLSGARNCGYSDNKELMCRPTHSDLVVEISCILVTDGSEGVERSMNKAQNDSELNPTDNTPRAVNGIEDKGGSARVNVADAATSEVGGDVDNENAKREESSSEEHHRQHERSKTGLEKNSECMSDNGRSNSRGILDDEDKGSGRVSDPTVDETPLRSTSPYHRPRRSRTQSSDDGRRRQNSVKSCSRDASSRDKKPRERERGRSSSFNQQHTDSIRRGRRCSTSMNLRPLGQTRYAARSLVPVGQGHPRIRKLTKRSEIKEMGRAREWASFCRRKTYLTLADLSREERPRMAKKGAVTPFALNLMKVRMQFATLKNSLHQLIMCKVVDMADVAVQSSSPSNVLRTGPKGSDFGHFFDIEKVYF